MTGPQTYRNLAPVLKNKLAKRATSKYNSNVTPIFFLASPLTKVLTLNLTPAPALGLLSIYINVDLQKAPKLVVKLFV